ATPALYAPRYAREVRDFFRAHPVLEATRAVKQALEMFRLNAELRRRATPDLAGWLAGPGAGGARHAVRMSAGWEHRSWRCCERRRCPGHPPCGRRCTRRASRWSRPAAPAC